MTRLAKLILAASVLAAGTPAVAAPHFVAEPVTVPMEDRVIAKNAVWQRSGSAFGAARGSTRPAVVCSALVRKVGRLKSFSIGGAPIAAKDLEKCNARAQ